MGGERASAPAARVEETLSGKFEDGAVLADLDQLQATDVIALNLAWGWAQNG